MILIVGSSRSGTTWLAKIFDSHPDVLYRHEPDSIHLEPALPSIPERVEDKDRRSLAARYLKELAANRSPKSIGSQPMFPKRYRGSLGSMAYKGYVLMLKGMGLVAGGTSWYRTFQSPDLIPKREPAPLYVIKSVNSLSRAPLFCRADSNLKVIHIARHPCGRIASILRGHKRGLMCLPSWLPEIADTQDGRSKGLTKQAMKSMSIEGQLASHWMLQNDKVMRELDGNPQYVQLRYEDLCAAPEGMARQLFEFAGLDWHLQCEQFLTQSQSAQGSAESYFSLVRKPAEAAEKWRDELDDRQVADILAAVRNSLPGKLYEQPQS